MIGQAMAPLAPLSRRWLRRVWGHSDIHLRQKWQALWPILARLPEEGIALLDAGCGPGLWSLELAARRPGWKIVGLDLLEESIREAEAAREALALGNVSFVCGDYLGFRAEQPFDVVLSVHSSYALVEANQGPAEFRCFRSWLRRDGVLLLLAPRRSAEAPLLPWLPQPEWREAFSAEQLRDLCAVGEFSIERLEGSIGPLGAAAKQISWLGASRPALVAAGLYPLCCLLAMLGKRVPANGAGAALAWLLVARSAAREHTRAEAGDGMRLETPV